jgi:1-deoxy-D-xylulose-5-phosphate synthase
MESVIDEAEKQGVSVAHYDMRFLKPIDTDILRQVGEKFRYIVTLEDGCVTGGLGSAVVEYMSEKGYNPTIKVMGIPDKFVEHGTPEELYRVCGMDKDSVLNAILNFKNL